MLDFRESYDFDGETNKKAKILKEFIETNILPINKNLKHKGIGLIQGIDFTGIDEVNATTGKVVKECFANGLILERAGREDCVVKCMPALTIEEKTLLRGLEILKNAIKKVLSE